MFNFLHKVKVQLYYIANDADRPDLIQPIVNAKKFHKEYYRFDNMIKYNKEQVERIHLATSVLLLFISVVTSLINEKAAVLSFCGLMGITLLPLASVIFPRIRSVLNKISVRILRPVEYTERELLSVMMYSPDHEISFVRKNLPKSLKTSTRDYIAVLLNNNPDETLNYDTWGFLAKIYSPKLFAVKASNIIIRTRPKNRLYFLDVFCNTCNTTFRFFLDNRCSCRLNCKEFDVAVINENFIPVGTLGYQQPALDGIRKLIPMWDKVTDTYQRADIKELWIGDEPGIDCNFVVTKLLLLLTNEEFISNDLIIRIVGTPDLNINTMRIINTYKLTGAAQ